ncbi:MAG TPA: NYN domain-containing protein [Planctomycetaceae bacterium]|jgi:uncharacterized LabA/DUF88 family protein
MANRELVYVDGESHFIRAQAAWREIHGDNVSLEQLQYQGENTDGMLLFKPKAKIFWTRRFNAGIERAVYFTSFAGDEVGLHQIKMDLREFNLEPSVYPENRQQAQQRQNALTNDNLIEKAKTVDIQLTVRMLHDAQRVEYDVCHLYTSDSDFLPVIQAVQALGRRVYVHGFKKALSKLPDLLHVPDFFVDLEETLRNECTLRPDNVTQ